MGTRFIQYSVRNGVVTSGFRERQVSAAFTAHCTAPSEYLEPTLSNPRGHVRLVRIESGPYAVSTSAPTIPE